MKKGGTAEFFSSVLLRGQGCFFIRTAADYSQNKHNESEEMKMKKLKKLFALMMAVMMLLTMVACGGDDSNEADGAVTYKVGIVQYMDHASLNQIVESIQTRLDERGAELDIHFEYEKYYQNGQGDPSVINQCIADLLADEVDIIIPIATPVAIAAQTATEDLDIPVVFSAVSDPVSAGLVESLDAPGGNITGTSDYLDTNAIMELIFAADPDCDKVGLLYDAGQDSSTAAIASAKEYLNAKGVAFVEKNGSTTDEILLAAEALVSEGVDAVFTPTDNTVMKAELTIYEVFAEAKIPHYGGADSFALNGAFCSYGVDYINLGVMTADMVVDMLINGKTPAETAVMTFDSGIATVNTEICEMLGYDLETIRCVYEPLCTALEEVVTAENFE